MKLGGDVSVKVRLVDCVGFMVDGAAGHMEDGAERLVKTPWYETEIPFTQAAEIGTPKSDCGPLHHRNRGDLRRQFR